VTSLLWWCQSSFLISSYHSLKHSRFITFIPPPFVHASCSTGQGAPHRQQWKNHVLLVLKAATLEFFLHMRDSLLCGLRHTNSCKKSKWHTLLITFLLLSCQDFCFAQHGLHQQVQLLSCHWSFAQIPTSGFPSVFRDKTCFVKSEKLGWRSENSIKSNKRATSHPLLTAKGNNTCWIRQIESCCWFATQTASVTKRSQKHAIFLFCLAS